MHWFDWFFIGMPLGAGMLAGVCMIWVFADILMRLANKISAALARKDRNG